MLNTSDIKRKSLLKVKGKEKDIKERQKANNIKIILKLILSPINAIITEAILEEML